MTQKEQLVELLHYYFTLMCNNDPITSNGLADYLLSNGVIVPPCKVGDTVYCVDSFYDRIIEENIEYLSYDSEDQSFEFVTTATRCFDEKFIGNFVFLSLAAAERALKERDGK